MKAQLLVLSAAGLLLASAVQAAPSASDQFIEATRAEALVRLSERGVDVAGKPFAVRVGVGADRLSAVSVAKSSGSAELDAQAVSALRRLKTGPAPAELIGRAVVLSLGEAAAVAAQ